MVLNNRSNLFACGLSAIVASLVGSLSVQAQSGQQSFSQMAASSGDRSQYASQEKSGFSDDQMDKPLFEEQDKPLFSGPLFGDTDTVISKPLPSPEQNSASKIDNRYRVDQRDQQMRGQMQQVAQWLTTYGIRNGSRFPGYVNDEMYAAQVQLSELVPVNPYNPGSTIQTAGFGIPAHYNANGSPATGSPIWQDDYTSHLQAQQNARVLLNVDAGITPLEIDEWTKHPPEDWQADPGTITAIGNNQGLFIVWGAGADGKPIQNLYTGGTLIVVGTTSGTVNDQIAPNEK